MVTEFLRHGGLRASLLQLAVELFWLSIAAFLAILFLRQIQAPELPEAAAPEVLYAVLIVAFNIGFGVYRRKESLARSTYFTRVLIASALATVVAYILADALPGGDAFRESVGVAALFAISGLLLLRHAIVLPLIDNLLPYRVIVIGTGTDARQVEASLERVDTGMQLVGFYPLARPEETVVSPQRVLPVAEFLPQTVKKLRVNEIIVAVRQQRGGVLPLRELLACRLNGVRVSDLAQFFERVHGHVPLDMSRSSWFIYGSGYRQGWLRALNKRAFDLVVATLLLLPALPLMVLASVAIFIESPGPVIYRQERVGRRGKRFTLLKFRSMTRDAEKDGKPAATHQRAAGRDERGGPTTGTSGIRRHALGASTVLRHPSQRQTGDHRMGAGSLLLRRDDRGQRQEARVRHLLRQESLDASRCAHPPRNHPGGIAGRRRSIGESLTSLPIVNSGAPRAGSQATVQPPVRPDLPAVVNPR